MQLIMDSIFKSPGEILHIPEYLIAILILDGYLLSEHLHALE